MILGYTMRTVISPNGLWIAIMAVSQAVHESIRARERMGDVWSFEGVVGRILQFECVAPRAMRFAMIQRVMRSDFE
jgi:hypothetical protein